MTELFKGRRAELRSELARVVEAEVSGGWARSERTQESRAANHHGMTHSIENVGSDAMVVLSWASELLDQQRPDAHSLEVLRA